MSSALLEAHDVTLAYGSRTVLRDVSLAVREGEFWFLLGPNAEGKTTFLKAVLGLLPATRGRLTLDPRLGREGIGFVPQRCDLNAGLPTTLREFVRLGAVGTSLTRSAIDDRLGSALGRVGLSGQARTAYWSLSGGQRQRALIARALLREPRLLILDEPTNGLDLPSEEQVLRFLEELNRRDRVTLLFVTHDLQIAARHATHVALFGGGTVVAGPRDEMLTDDRLARVYGTETSLAGILRAAGLPDGGRA